MKIHIACDSKMPLGGGFSFIRNFKKGLTYFQDYKIVERIEDADVCLVPSTSMVTRQTIDKIKNLNKKLVVRNDNLPKNSNNRNTGTSRLIEFSQRADKVVWQCEWSKDYLSDLTSIKNGQIIYNSIDETVFKPEGEKYSFGGRPNYLYTRYGRDENKRWGEVFYRYQKIHKENSNAKLIIIGKFSNNLIQYKFDFCQNEKIDYRGIIYSQEETAKNIRACDKMFAVYFIDCFSTSYLEFLMTKNPKKFEDVMVDINMSGGTPEMINLWNTKGREYFSLKRMTKEYIDLFNNL